VTDSARYTSTAVLDDGDTILRMRRYVVAVTAPDGEVREHDLARRSITLGSHPDCDVVLDDPEVSRHHAQLEAQPDGFRLRDLGSKNGSWLVAGATATRFTDIFLEAGSVWRLGRHLLRFTPTEEQVEVRLSGRGRFGAMLGASTAMRELFGVLARVAPTEATVLVEGESGTGKELVARAVHDHSKRAKGPFVVFDCSAVPRDLAESELFGHVRGAFTGAVSDRKGAFELASGGTLFLDELGELAPDLQPKLLRALESRRVHPVGGSAEVACDTRIVAATNRDLKREVGEGNFREDLYYRLAVIQVQLPPLRKRVEDIPLLVEHFLGELSRAAGRSDLQVSFSTMEKLKRHRWPGNVRELRNFVERAAVLAEGGRVETRFLRIGQERTEPGASSAMPEGFAGAISIDEDMPFKDAKARLVEAFEVAYWRALLERTAGNVSQAARIAGVHRKSVEYIMRKLDLRRGEGG
jgi:DNA-binding NtrC family response regulator